MKCSVCGFDMELWKNSKWICSNPDCTNTILVNVKAWYEKLVDDSSLWSEKILSQAPSVIAHEYSTLRDMLKKGEVSGIILQLKDAFEVALKFPVLIVLSDAFKNDSTKKLYRDVLYSLTCKLPSLGDWFNAVKKLLQLNKIADADLKFILNDICRVYEENRIVNWRNQNIGHGAFTSTENENFREDISSKIKILAEHFKRCEKIYEKIKLLAKIKGKFIPLNGRAVATNIKSSDLYFSCSSGKEKPKPLVPLIRAIANEIYFFDSYISRKNKTAYLDYVSGNKLMNVESEIGKLYKFLMTSAKVEQTELSAEDEIRGKRSEKALEEILRPDNLIQFDFLSNKLEDIISADNRGIYLLEMLNGMGKTTFSKMLDGLAYNKVKLPGVMCRAFYINGVYSHSKLAFIQGLTDSLRRAENDDTLTGDIPTINLESPDAANQIADLINKLFEVHKKISDVKKLLIIIDGVDEIPNTDENSLIDLIPRREKLSDGVHILLTCRTPAQTSEYTKTLLKTVAFDKVITVDDKNEEYRATLKNFIAAKTKASENIVDKIFETAEGRALSLENIIRAYLQTGEKFFDQPHENLFDFLRELYGERYYTEILSVAARLTSIPVPITIHDLAHLSDDEFVTFKLIAYIGELKPVLDIRHTSNGTVIAVTRPEVREMLKSQDKICKTIYGAWTDDLKELKAFRMNQDGDIFTSSGNYLNDSRKKLILLKYLGLCSAKEKYRNDFVRSKTFITCSQTLAVNISNDTEWNYNAINILIKLLCREVAPIFKEIKYDENVASIIFLVQKIVEHTENYGGEIADTVQSLQMLFEIMQDKRFDFPTLFDFCNFIGTMLAKLNRHTEAAEYFGLADELISHMDLIKISDGMIKSAGSESVWNTFSLIKSRINRAVTEKNLRRYSTALEHLNIAKNLLDGLEKTLAANNPFKSKFDILTTVNLIMAYRTDILKNYGNVYKHTDPEKALEYFKETKKILDSKKKIEKDNVNFKDAKADLLLNTGQTYRALKMYDEAVECYDEGIALVEDMRVKGDVVDIEQLVSFYNSRGNVERDLENHEDAIKYLTKALDIVKSERRRGKFINKGLVKNIEVTLEDERRRLADEKRVSDTAQDDSEEFNDSLLQMALSARPEALNLSGLNFLQEGYYNTAMKFFKKSAECGNADGLFSVGLMYAFGYGVPVDPDKFKEYYQKARKAGLNLKKYGSLVQTLHNQFPYII